MQLQLARASRVGIEYANMLCGAGASFCLSTAAESPVTQARIFETKRERGPCIACMRDDDDDDDDDDKEEKKYGSARVESLFGAFFQFFSTFSPRHSFFSTPTPTGACKKGWLEVLEETLTGCASRGGSVAQVHHSAREDRTYFSHSTRSDSLPPL